MTCAVHNNHISSMLFLDVSFVLPCSNLLNDFHMQHMRTVKGSRSFMSASPSLVDLAEGTDCLSIFWFIHSSFCPPRFTLIVKIPFLFVSILNLVYR